MKKNDVAIPASYVRGGTSRAVLFELSDLPDDRQQWAAIFQRALGSPDPAGRQLDGLGGGISSLSKVAVLAPSHQGDHDIDYHFFQVEPKTGDIQNVATCGNIISSVGPFAAEKGWTDTGGAVCRVKIFDANSGKTVISTFPNEEDPSRLIAIDGVPGVAPEVRLAFMEPGGAVTGALFPTGSKTESLRAGTSGTFEVTLIDATLPTVVLTASQLGLHGAESPAELSSPRLLELLEEIRIAAGLRMGLAADPTILATALSNMPDIAIVSAAGEDGSIQSRFYTGGGIHKAAPVTSSIALACSCQLEGTVVSSIVTGARAASARWDIKHPAGSMSVDVLGTADGQSIDSATVARTTRVIMEGKVRLPASYSVIDQPPQAPINSLSDQ